MTNTGRMSVQPDGWLEISVELPSEFAEPVTHLFSRYGDGRVFVSQTGGWDADEVGPDYSSTNDVTVFCYLKIDDTLENRKGMIEVGLRLISELADVSPHKERIVTADEWSNQTFPEIRVGDRIVISPWSIGDGIPKVDDAKDVRVYLSPGLAFGTGNHPTTRLCLTQIVAEADVGAVAGSRILDLGCGSGILSIVALKLGASEAWCLDIDETAIRAVRDNLTMSGVGERAYVLDGSLPNAELPDTKFDYVFANITSRVLIDLAQPIIENTKPGGTILASGILADQLESVRTAFLDSGPVTITDMRQDADWLMLRITKYVSE